jgi:hypothetical protein
MKDMVRIQGKLINKSQIGGCEPLAYRVVGKEPIFNKRIDIPPNSRRDIQEIVADKPIEEAVLVLTIDGRKVTLTGQAAEEAWEDLQG